MKAIVLVDVQKDFIDGALKNEKAVEVTPKIVEFAKDCVAKGYKIYATRDTHEKTVYNNPALVLSGELVPESGYMTTLEGKRLPVEHCIEGTDGWMIDDRLMEVIEGKCTFINKPTFGSLKGLEEVIDEDIQSGHILDNLSEDGKWAEMHLDRPLLDEIVICGFCTGICVLANAVILRAKFPNIKITVMKDLCACVTPESHENAINALKMQQIDVA